MQCITDVGSEFPLDGPPGRVVLCISSPRHLLYADLKMGLSATSTAHVYSTGPHKSVNPVIRIKYMRP
jgi:hypothetical protein